MTLDRRSLLSAAAFSLAASQIAGRALAQTSPEVVPLWPAAPPSGPGPGGEEQVDTGKHPGAVSNVSHPRLMVFRPAKPNGAAVLIGAGGGYRRIEIENESVPAAKWLQARGVTAFVITYRLPGEGWTTVDVPFQDAQRAMRIIRSRASQFGLDPAKIGCMGFSSGGHLMGTLATRSAASFYPAADAIDAVSARPDFAALLYPVIALRPPFDHTVTRRSLVGEHPTLEQADAYSVDTHVRAHCPPTFLAQAADDPVSPIDNSLLMFAALRQAGTPAEMHVFQTGGHGFGLGAPGSPTASWPELFGKWAANNGLFTAG